ncbi:GNAT family N-acetyltransferase [Vibrio rumoiensis]|uniref:GNAT family N-acetyltransferase n=1 Tax=Vibrio rumoiensis 1S-45 TaxID=1188252 RepID=A0A1E5E2R7_9VIBR|nr:N-acetyltransferase [Vibrio rumoiensis]OEF25847.1 GNAT family N-acetyltransferase [Vibrio rumoiensis 1S-45]
MLIRTEAPADILTIDSLLRQTFPTSSEAKLVRSLRENSRFTLSLVACSDEGEVIGHVLFTPVTIDGDDLGWQGLAPVAVKEEYRGQGIAEALIRSGLDSLYEFGYSACFVLGSPHYYSRLGFQDGAPMGLVSIYNVMPEYQVGAFQALALADGAFDGQAGLVEYSPEFNAI